jgi:ligand-binding sensor domain-containing protein
MQTSVVLKHRCNTAVILVSLMLFIACERNAYQLLDPASAGEWTLYTTADGLPSNQVRYIKLDSKNNLWFTFPGYGIAKFDNESWTYYRTGATPLLNDGVICLAEASDGRIIFGTSDGLSILGNNNVWSSYIDPVTSMFVNTIKIGSNGWIWVGTQDQGFYLNKNDGLGFIKNLTALYKNVNIIEEGFEGNIFLGTDNGIIRWDGTNYSYLTTVNGLPHNKVTSIRLDTKERLWIGTDGGKTVSWIDRNGMHQLNLMTGSDSLFVKDILEDRKGDLWFATYNNGLIRYDGIVPHVIKVFDGTLENKVNCIEQDKDGNLWFGLNSKGVVKYTLPIDIR